MNLLLVLLRRLEGLPFEEDHYMTQQIQTAHVNIIFFLNRNLSSWYLLPAYIFNYIYRICLYIILVQNKTIFILFYIFLCIFDTFFVSHIFSLSLSDSFYFYVVSSSSLHLYFFFIFWARAKFFCLFFMMKSPEGFRQKPIVWSKLTWMCLFLFHLDSVDIQRFYFAYIYIYIYIYRNNIYAMFGNIV